MATRIYYTDTAWAGITPAVDATWEVTPNTRRHMTLVPSGSTGNSAGFVGSGSNPNDSMRHQFFSPQLAKQTIAGTVKGQIMAFEAASATNASSQMVIRAVSADGTSVRGTLLAGHTSAISSEWNPTTPRNVKMPRADLSPASLSSTAVEDGDYLLIEIGARITSTNTGNNAMRWVGSGAADLPENETQTTDGYPWIEFSQNLIWLPVPYRNPMPPIIAQ